MVVSLSTKLILIYIPVRNAGGGLNRNEIPFPITGRQTTREKILEGIRDWGNGGKHFHEHTDEEVDRLIAEAENRQKTEGRSKAKRRTAKRSPACQ